MEFILEPIGIIHTPFKTKDECPIQGAVSADSIGQILVNVEYEEGLKDIVTFSHIILFYRFDRAGEIKLIRPTFLDDSEHGIFASRHPCRMNAIGISIVRLLSRKNNILEVGGIDILNETPLLDIKPYIPKFDCFPEASNGWVEKKELRPKPPGRE